MGYNGLFGSNGEASALYYVVPYGYPSMFSPGFPHPRPSSDPMLSRSPYMLTEVFFFFFFFFNNNTQPCQHFHYCLICRYFP